MADPREGQGYWQAQAAAIEQRDAQAIAAAEAYSQALRTLLRVCDGAITEDGAGFSGPDAGPARSLAYTDPLDWSPKQIEQAYELLRHYRNTQLPSWGIDFASLPVYEREDAASWEARRERRERSCRTIEADEYGALVVRFPRSVGILDRVRALPGPRRFEPGDGKDVRPYWLVTPSAGNVSALLSLVEDWGFTVTDAAAAILSAPTKPERRVEREGDAVALYFPYNYADKEAVKGIPGAAFRKEPDARWVVPVSPASAPLVLAFVQAKGLEVPQDLRDQLEAAGQEAAELALASRSAEAGVPQLEGYVSATKGYTPMAFQLAGIAYALRVMRCFIADQMGLGKTVQALLTMHVTKAYPALVLCPASVKLNWAREAAEWLTDGRKVQVLQGRTDKVDPSADLYVANYDIARYYVDPLNARGLRTLVLDESHYAKSPTAQRTIAATALAYRASYDEVRTARSSGRFDGPQGVEYRLLLSGTPLTSRPIELMPQLRILGRFGSLFGSWASYVRKYCNAYHNGYGWDVRGANEEALPQLNATMRASCYIRRDESQARLELPPLVTSGVLLPISNRAAYRKASADIVTYVGLMAQELARAAAELEGLDKGSAEAAAVKARNAARMRAMRAEQLVRTGRLRSILAEGKIPAAIGWLEDWLASSEGAKLVLFVHHKAAQQKLLEALVAHGDKEGYKVAHVLGADSQATRQDNIDAFQTDPDVRVIVCSLMAAREGITLTAAYTVAFLELDWVPGTHMQAERRVLRIGQGHTCWAYYLLAEDTTDEVLAPILDAKRRTVTGAADGTRVEGGADGMAALLSYLATQEGVEGLPTAELGAALASSQEDEVDELDGSQRPLEAAAEREAVGVW